MYKLRSLFIISLIIVIAALAQSRIITGHAAKHKSAAGEARAAGKISVRVAGGDNPYIHFADGYDLPFARAAAATNNPDASGEQSDVKQINY